MEIGHLPYWLHLHKGEKKKKNPVWKNLLKINKPSPHKLLVEEKDQVQG